MNKLTLDLSGCYYKDILIDDLLYVIGDDRFYRITKVEFNKSWITVHNGEFSYVGDIDETLPKTEFRLYRERYVKPFSLA